MVIGDSVMVVGLFGTCKDSRGRESLLCSKMISDAAKFSAKVLWENHLQP